MNVVKPATRRALLAGAIAGVAGVATFLVVHAWWILPIWGIAPVGVPVAALGGVAVGWAYDVHRHALPRRRAVRTIAVVAGGALAILPGEVIALVRGPVPIAVLSQMTIATAAVAFAAFIAGAASVGALAGALVTRTRKAALVSALAAIAVATGVGHNAPFIGYGFVAAKMWTIMLAALAAAAVALVAIDSRGTFEREATASPAGK